MGAAGNKKPKKSKNKKDVPSYVSEELAHETPLKNKKHK
ncbi:RNA-binding protein [Odoribacter sp. AF15-53]|nr:RNA-binding protein [Odoribacter sp. AF15-53]